MVATDQHEWHLGREGGGDMRLEGTADVQMMRICLYERLKWDLWAAQL